MSKDTIKVEYALAGKAMEQRNAWIGVMIHTFMQQYGCGIEDIELCERTDETGLCWFIRKREPLNSSSDVTQAIRDGMVTDAKVNRYSNGDEHERR